MIENLEVASDERHQLDIVVSDDNIANINISINSMELLPYQKKFIEEKRKHVVLRGYRKGTAPISMVAKFFAEEAKDAAQNNILYSKYTKLLQDHKLQPLTQPKLEKLFEEDNKICANFRVEVLQPVMLNQYLGLDLQKMPHKSIDNFVIKTYDELKQKYPKLIEMQDAIVENGKLAVVDFVMSVDNNEVEKQTDLKVLFGSDLYYVEFESNILGLSVGNIKEFNILFPHTYSKDHLKGKDAHFILTVKSIFGVSQYSDDELATVLNYKNKEDMLASITKEIEIKHKEEEHLFYENQVLGQLLSTHDFRLPKTLIDNEMKKIVIEKPELSIEQALKIAERFVRTDLILNAIYERHPDINLTQEIFNAKIAELTTRANDSVEATIEKLQSAGKMQQYINYLKNCQVINFLIEMATIKELETKSINTEENKDGESR